MSYHQATVVGNICWDPELKYTQAGQAVCNFIIAVSEQWADRQSGKKSERTTLYRVAVWGAQAESCNTYLAKGRQVRVFGNVSTIAYISTNGEARALLELNARYVKLLGGARSTEQPQQQQQQQTEQYHPDTIIADDIPF